MRRKHCWRRDHDPRTSRPYCADCRCGSRRRDPHLSEGRQAQLTYDQTGVYKFVDFPELGRIFSQAETPSFEEKTKLFFWMIGQMRAREYEWLQYQNGAITKESWETYQGVIYFVLGTPRGRALWQLCRGYFNTGFADMVDGMVRDVPPIDLWDQLQAVE